MRTDLRTETLLYNNNKLDRLTVKTDEKVRSLRQEMFQHRIIQMTVI